MASFNCRISPRTSTVILRRKVAAGNGRCHFGDVSHLAGKVAGHGVHGVRQILPRSGHARHQRLPAELAVGAHFAGHARHFSGEHAQLLNHGVHDVGRAQKLAFKRASVHVQPHGLRQIALRHGGNGARYFGRRPQQVFNQRVDRDFHVVPGAAALFDADSLSGLAFFAHRLADALQLERHLLVGDHDLVEVVGDLARQSGPGHGKAHAEVAILSWFPNSAEPRPNTLALAAALERRPRKPAVERKGNPPPYFSRWRASERWFPYLSSPGTEARGIAAPGLWGSFSDSLSCEPKM